jgi:ankyrin repeat protein
MPVRRRLKIIFGNNNSKSSSSDKNSRVGQDNSALVVRRKSHALTDPSQTAPTTATTVVPTSSKTSLSPRSSSIKAQAAAQPSVLPTAAAAAASTSPIRPSSLWDQAYDNLKSSDEALVTEYENLLSKQITTINSSPDSNTNTHTARQAQLNLIIFHGLQRFSSRKTKYNIAGHTFVLQDQISQVVGVVQDVKDFVSSAVSSSPQASLVWAGVCIILPLLTNPTTAEKANSDGFTYVTSRMEYYTKLEEFLLLPRGKAQDDEFEELRGELEKFLVDLYQQILGFQLRSILRFYRNSVLNFLRDVSRHENWEGMLQGIKDAEDTLDAKSKQVSDAVSVQYLTNVDNAADQSHKALRNMLSKIEESLELARQQSLIASQQLDVQTQIAQKILSEDERKCHQMFRLVKDENSNPYEWHKDRVEERVEGTCQWFLGQSDFEKWLQAESGLLTVSADPGCGKSVLARFLIDHHLPKAAETATASICYFFFKDQDQNTLRQALCAMLHQLFSLKPALIRHAMEHHKKNGNNLVNITTLLFSILEKACEDPEAGSVIFVVDALDECSIPDLQQFIKMLRKQFNPDNRVSWKTKFLLTSRPYEHVMSEFRLLTESSGYIHIPGENESGAISQEVNCVIQHRVRQLEKEKSLSLDMSKHLLSKLLAVPHRTYLWVYLVFEDFKSQDFRKTKKGVDAIINTLPESVNEAYEKILQKSKKNERSMVRKALSIILAAKRPLSLAEMNIAVNVNIDSKTDEDLDLENEQDFGKRLRSWCGLFISMFQDKVYFLHQTAREFLLYVETSSPVQLSLNTLQTWNRSITSEQADAILAVSCIVYLDRMLQQYIQCKDLLAYASEYWPSHYRRSGKNLDERLTPFLARLCDPGDPGFTTWYNNPSPFNRIVLDNSNMLCVAAYLGIHTLVEHLMASNKELDVDEKDDLEGITPLALAAVHGREEVVKLLLETGKVDVNSSDRYGYAALYYAIGGGHDAVIYLLLETGKVDMNYKNRGGCTPLHYASNYCDEAAVRLILERYDDYLYVDSKDDFGRTGLSIAAEEGSERIISLLLDTGKADPDSRCWKGRTPLSYAAEYGDSEVIKLLLEAGKVDVDAKDETSRTPLHWAAAAGDLEAVRLLVDLGKANPELFDDTNSTPLQAARANSHSEVIRFLEARQQLVV